MRRRERRRTGTIAHMIPAADAVILLKEERNDFLVSREWIVL
jgi:hypothetical protein